MNEVIDRFGSIGMEASIQNIALNAFLGKAMALFRLNRLPEALTTYDEILNRNNVSDTLESEVLLAEAMVAKGRVLVHMNCLEAALTVRDDVVRRFGSNDHPELQLVVKLTQLERAELHLAMGQGDTSVAAADRLLEQLDFEIPESPRIRCQGHLTRARAISLRTTKRHACGMLRQRCQFFLRSVLCRWMSSIAYAGWPSNWDRRSCANSSSRHQYQVNFFR